MSGFYPVEGEANEIFIYLFIYEIFKLGKKHYLDLCSRMFIPGSGIWLSDTALALYV